MRIFEKYEMGWIRKVKMREESISTYVIQTNSMEKNRHFCYNRLDDKEINKISITR